jgi:hypothetical protein
MLESVLNRFNMKEPNCIIPYFLFLRFVHFLCSIYHSFAPLLTFVSSSAIGASDYYLLEALDVQYVVVAAHGLPQRFGNVRNLILEGFLTFLKAIRYLPLPIEDWIGEDILSHFDESIEFIEEARIKGKAVLVHWYQNSDIILFIYLSAAGISRSASVCIAYLMKYQKLTYEEARKEVAQVGLFIYFNLPPPSDDR